MYNVLEDQEVTDVEEEKEITSPPEYVKIPLPTSDSRVVAMNDQAFLVKIITETDWKSYLDPETALEYLRHDYNKVMSIIDHTPADQFDSYMLKVKKSYELSIKFFAGCPNGTCRKYEHYPCSGRSYYELELHKDMILDTYQKICAMPCMCRKAIWDDKSYDWLKDIATRSAKESFHYQELKHIVDVEESIDWMIKYDAWCGFTAKLLHANYPDFLA